MLSTIVNKQREQYVYDKSLETAVKSLEYSVNTLVNAKTEEVNGNATDFYNNSRTHDSKSFQSRGPLLIVS